MRFSSTAGALRGCVATAAQVTPRLSDRPAHTGVLLEVSGDALVVCGSDGETSVTSRLAVGPSIPGSVLLSPRPLLGFLATLDDEATVTVSLGDADQLVVEPTGRSPYRFRPMVGSFTRPGGSRLSLKQVDLSQLQRGLKALSSAVSREHGGVQLVSDDEDLVLNATDNYRLAHVRIRGGGFGVFSGVVALSVLELVARAGLDQVAADARGTLIRFASDSASVVTRLLAVPFPPTEALLSARGPHSAVLPVPELRSALRPLELVAASRPLEVSVDGDVVTVSASNLEVGAGTEQVRLASPASGPSFRFAVAADYLRDALAATDAEELRLWWSAPDAALFFTTLEGAVPEAVTVVMPQTL